ncbi:copper resistance protein CopC [Streptomyces sp. NPDC048291]|uniref:copper resistance CopC family protein n=1 Tax=Streptomyces sp. NPDC048291 TaxID=3365530 RepID=UPI00371DB0D8
MPARPPRAARTAARVLVVPTALTALTVAAPQAAAHTELDTASPAADSAPAGLPTRITPTFSDTMDGKYAKVAVTGPDGAPVSAGSPQVGDRTVALGLKSVAPAGRHTVGYRVVSAAGHPVSGSYAVPLSESLAAYNAFLASLCARGRRVATPPTSAAAPSEES